MEGRPLCRPSFGTRQSASLRLNLDRERPNLVRRESDPPQSYRSYLPVLSVCERLRCDSPTGRHMKCKDDNGRSPQDMMSIRHSRSIREKHLPVFETRRTLIVRFQTALSFFQVYLFNTPVAVMATTRNGNCQPSSVSLISFNFGNSTLSRPKEKGLTPR